MTDNMYTEVRRDEMTGMHFSPSTSWSMGEGGKKKKICSNPVLFRVSGMFKKSIHDFTQKKLTKHRHLILDRSTPLRP